MRVPTYGMTLLTHFKLQRAGSIRRQKNSCLNDTLRPRKNPDALDDICQVKRRHRALKFWFIQSETVYFLTCNSLRKHAPIMHQLALNMVINWL